MKEQTRKEMQRKMADCRMSAPEVSWTDIEQAVGVRPRAAVLRRRLTAAAAAVGLLLAVGAGLRLRHRAQSADPAGSVAEDVDVREPVSPAGETFSSSSGWVSGLSSGRLVASNEASSADRSAASEGGPGERFADAPGRDTMDGTPVHEPETVRGWNDGVVSGGHPDPDAASAETGVPSPDRATGTAAPATESASRQQPFQGTEETSRTPGRSRSGGPSHATDRSAISRSAKGQRWTAQAFMGNAMTGHSGSSSFTPLLMSAPPFGVYDEEMARGDIVSLRGDNLLSTDVRHHRPVRFGLTLQYGRDRWSAESGLTLSLQKSEFTSRTGDRSAVTEQHLAYIGIPLNAGYRIWSGGGFHFYATVGGMVEKMVKGSRTVPSVTGENRGNATTEEVRIRPLQFSLNGAVGAEYRIGRSLGLYAEPGLTYRFDNGSVVPTLYRDEPFDFNLTLGLRFAFPVQY